MAKEGTKVITLNRKARHDYFIEDTYEAGIELFGTEVKSLRQGTVNLKDSFCFVKNGEIFMHGCHISPYEKGNIFNKDPLRSRKLLMHKREIAKLQMLAQRDGYSLVPLILLVIPSTIYTNVALIEELDITDLIVTVGFIWTVLLIFVGMMVTHDYTLSKNFITTLGTIVAMVFIMFVAILFTTLVGKIVSFITNIVTEVSYRM